LLTRLDHLVILVNDLDLAAADYERLGFTVTPGGEHADGLTRNALIPFDDGFYFKLVSAPDVPGATASLATLAGNRDIYGDPVRLGACALSPVEGGDAAPGPMAVQLPGEVRESRELDPLPTHGVGIRLQFSEG
jgi:Glyoxalase-like domain